jgi:hypothetical protein
MGPYLCLDFRREVQASQTKMVVYAAPNQSVHYFLQLSQPCWAASKEDHWAWVLMFLHPCKDAAVTSEPSISWLQKWSLSKPGLLRYPLDLSISLLRIIPAFLGNCVSTYDSKFCLDQEFSADVYYPKKCCINNEWGPVFISLCIENCYIPFSLWTDMCTRFTWFVKVICFLEDLKLEYLHLHNGFTFLDQNLE